ncbi:MAG: N-acetyl-alpha-D-glucosaminyl L-malate synthase BshA [Ktedonobacteraceae bacterium]
MSDLRIYIAISTFHPLVGGAEKQALLQARSLRERGHRATIVTFHHEKRWLVREVIEGVPVMRVAGRLLGERKKLPRVLQRLVYLLAMLVMGWTLWQHRHRYDLLHVYQLNLLALPTALACRLTGKPLVVAVRSALLPGGKQTSNPIIPLLRVDKTTRIIHDLADLERFGWPVVRFTRFLLRSKQVMVVILSSRMREYLAVHHFILPNIQLIPNGVDTRRFQVIQATCTARVGNYSDNRSEAHLQTVVSVSRLSYEKGIDVLLLAWQLVYKEVPQAKLLIVGNGPLEAQLVDMVEALGIAESVEFMGMQDDVAAQLHRSSIAVLPSRHEGMPNAVLEAMACGLPCVATRVSGSEDIIEQGVNGLLVEIEDYRDMAHALLALLRDAALTRKVGYAARATIEERYTLERVTDLYVKLYYTMVGVGDPSLRSG